MTPFLRTVLPVELKDCCCNELKFFDFMRFLFVLFSGQKRTKKAGEKNYRVFSPVSPIKLKYYGCAELKFPDSMFVLSLPLQRKYQRKEPEIAKAPRDFRG